MASLDINCISLGKEGWKISRNSIEKALAEETEILNTVNQLRNTLLNRDLQEVVDNKVTDGISNKKASFVSGPLVVQVLKVRNVCAAKAAEGGDGVGGCGRLLKVTLTDGSTTYHAIEFTSCPAISTSTAPGSKLLLQGRVPLQGGFLLIGSKNISVLGGKVDALYEKWTLTESAFLFGDRPTSCVNSDGKKPPPWVSFSKFGGSKTATNEQSVKGFKSLQEPGKDDGRPDQFAEQRKQALQQLVKESSGAKVFGGGKQMPDAAVGKVVSAGFASDVAKWALANNSNDVAAAIRELKAAASGAPVPPPPEQRGGGRRGGGRRGGGRRGGRGGGGPDDSDDDYESMRDAPRPSGPASLFDFFDAKLNERKEKVEFVQEMADVRGSIYDKPRLPEKSNDNFGRGRRSRGRSGPAGRVHQSSPAPDLSATHDWPAPGEEQQIKKRDTTTTFLQSQARMEQQEEDQLELERIEREAKMRTANERSGTAVNLSTGGSYRGSRDNNRGSKENNRGSSDNYRGSNDNYRSSRENYRGSRENCRGSNDNYRGSNDNYRGSRDNYSGSSDNYRGSNDNYRGSRDSYRGSRDNYRGSNDNYRGSGDNFKGNYRGSNDGYKGSMDGKEGGYTGYSNKGGNDSGARSKYDTHDSKSSNAASYSSMWGQSSSEMGDNKKGGGFDRGRREGGYDREGRRGGYDRGGRATSSNSYKKPERQDEKSKEAGYSNSRGSSDTSYGGGASAAATPRGAGAYNNQRDSFSRDAGAAGYDSYGRRGSRQNSRDKESTYNGSSDCGGYQSGSTVDRGYSGRGYQSDTGRGGYTGRGYQSDNTRSVHSCRGGYSGRGYQSDNTRSGYSGRGYHSSTVGEGYDKYEGSSRDYSSSNTENSQRSSANYTSAQEQLINQFKKSVELHGYTGYNEVQERSQDYSKSGNRY